MGASHSVNQSISELKHQNRTLIDINNKIKDELKDSQLTIIHSEQENQKLKIRKSYLEQQITSYENKLRCILENDEIINKYIAKSGVNFIDDEFEKNQIKNFITFAKENISY